METVTRSRMVDVLRSRRRLRQTKALSAGIVTWWTPTLLPASVVNLSGLLMSVETFP